MVRAAIASLCFEATLVLCTLTAQQPAGSDEVRVSSQPYVAQTGYTFRVETRVVDVGVTVRDGHGRAVAGLKREDFHILDEGQPRDIIAFAENHAGAMPAGASGVTPGAPNQAPAPNAAQPTRRPLYLAIFFDDVNVNNVGATADLKRAQAASTRLVKEHLPPGVLAGIFTASGADTLDFTADAAKLVDAIAALKPHAKFSDRICPRMSPYEAYRIAHNNDQETIRLVLIASAQKRCGVNRETVVAQAEEAWRQVKGISMETLASLDRVTNRLAAMPGDRVLLLASSGFVGQTLEVQQDRIIGEAVRAGITINSLVTQGLYNELMPGERFDDPAPQRAIYTALPGYQRWAKAEEAEVAERPMFMDQAMSNLARGTGGLLFEKNNDLNAGFRQLTLPPEVGYRLSFNPEGAVADGSYHELRVKLVRKGAYTVAARPGYFAQEVVASDKLREKIDRAVAGSESLEGIEAKVSPRIEPWPETGPIVRVSVHVDLAKLPFVSQNNRQFQRLTFVAAFFDGQGKMISAKEGRMDLALKSDTYRQMMQNGVNAELSFPLAPGDYRLRAVVGESVNTAVSAFTSPIHVQ